MEVNFKLEKVRLDLKFSDILLIVNNTIEKSNLNHRAKLVINKRFGINKFPRLSLEEIGKTLNITRERVRQIEKDSLKKIELKAPRTKLTKLHLHLKKFIAFYDGLTDEENIIKNAFKNLSNKKKVQGLLSLILSSNKDFIFLNKPKEFKRLWLLKNYPITRLKEFRAWLLNFFSNNPNPLIEKKLLIIIRSEYKVFSKQPDYILKNYLNILKDLRKSVLKKWGLKNWKKVRFKIGDRIFLIFKKENRPLHFSQVASLFNQKNKRKISPLTIHNELIKDKRFVLVGRGIYYLKTKIKYTGTVQDVLKKILQSHKEPITKEKLVEKTKKYLQVKKATILINLKNKKLFQNNKDGLFFFKTNES